MTPSIRPARDDDAPSLARIYNPYIRDTCITFETAPVTAQDMVERLAEVRAAILPWLVAEESSAVVGYAYASRWKGRCAYRFSAESTIYMDPASTGNGIGTLLYSELVSTLAALSMHAVIGGIALPNDRSVALHERLGFRKVAHFEQVGYKQDRWVDVGYWQRLI